MRAMSSKEIYEVSGGTLIYFDASPWQKSGDYMNFFDGIQNGTIHIISKNEFDHIDGGSAFTPEDLVKLFYQGIENMIKVSVEHN